MAESATDAGWLRNKRVAFTGRLASMTRVEARDLIHAYGGEFVSWVSRDTSLLVIGQEGWPLEPDGRLTRKLRKARSLQRQGCLISILPEEELFARLGLEAHANGIHRAYTTAQLSRLLHVPRDRIRAWMRAGLVKPMHTLHGVSYFDFRQVCGAKNLCALAGSGVTFDQIRRSFEQLQRWLGTMDQPLAQLALLERDGRMLIRLDGGQLAEPTGQLQFDLATEPAPAALPVTPQARTAEQYFDRGFEYEQARRLTEAADAYRQALLVGGPNANVCFNLANVLYSLGQKDQAAERLWQVIELDQDYAEAWNNLGNVLAELGQSDEAVRAYETALQLDPTYGDAHYNLADTLDQLGQPRKAQSHWQAYLRHEPRGAWADYARKRLAAGP